MGLFSRKTKKENTSAAQMAEVTLSDGNLYKLSQQVDCIGDSCPRPQLMTKKAISRARMNDVVEVMVDNPSSMEAVPPMCPELDATHLETVTDKHCWKIYIRKD